MLLYFNEQTDSKVFVMSSTLSVNALGKINFKVGVQTTKALQLPLTLNCPFGKVVLKSNSSKIARNNEKLKLSVPASTYVSETDEMTGEAITKLSTTPVSAEFDTHQLPSELQFIFAVMFGYFDGAEKRREFESKPATVPAYVGNGVPLTPMSAPATPQATTAPAKPADDLPF